MPKRRPVVFEGVAYESISAACAVHGEELRRWISRGCQTWAEVDAARSLQRQKQAVTQGKPCEWNGISYPSISEAARANNCHIGTMARWIARGWRSDMDIPAQYRRLRLK